MYNRKLGRGIAAAVTTALAVTAAAQFATDNAGNAGAAKPKLNAAIKPGNKTMYVGDTFKIKISKAPTNAKITWKSSNKKVATVNSKGKVKAKFKGKTTISAIIRYKGVKKTLKCRIKVRTRTYSETFIQSTSVPTAATSTQTAQPVPSQPAATPTPGKNITDITLRSVTDTKTKELKVGDSFNLDAVITPSDATLQDINITNSKDYVASVDDKGNVKARYIGNTTITLTAKNNPSVAASVRISVTDDFSQPDGFNVENKGIAHGTMGDLNYPSDYRPNGSAHARVWYPPGYDENDTNKKYNILFCLHGGSDNEYYWTGHSTNSNGGCRGDIVLDNLYATGHMEDTIVVFPNGVIQYNSNTDYPNVRPNPYLHSDNDFWVNHYLFEFELINNLIPYVKDELPIYGTPEHMAVCGLSMGCAQTMEIGFNNPDVFDYIGSFSAGPFEDRNQEFVRSEEDAALINEQIRLWFFITGENDHLHDNSMRIFLKTLEENNFDHVFYEVPGVGHDDYCWDRALYTFMSYAFK